MLWVNPQDLEVLLDYDYPVIYPTPAPDGKTRAIILVPVREFGEEGGEHGGFIIQYAASMVQARFIVLRRIADRTARTRLARD